MPMNWRMIGHQWAVNMLRGHISRQKVRHAYLITGADGLGKRTLGIRFAQALFCTKATESGEFCGECRACRLTEAGDFPDLHLIESEAPGAMIKVEQIRELQGQLALMPFESEWRVALCLRFHEANDNAANALLKTLEEPASRVVLILTARSGEALLPTIVSRCEVLPLRQVSDELISQALLARGLPNEDANLITRLADGRPGWAIGAGSDVEQLSRRAQWLDDMVELIPGSLAARFAYLDSMLEGKDTETQRVLALDALEQWASLWRDAMLKSYQAEGVLPRNIDREQDLEDIVRRIDVGTIGRVLSEAESVRAAILQNANVRLALETWFLDLPRG